MKIIVKNPEINPLNLARELGYTTTSYSQVTELNFVKIIGRNHYPRFHIYLKKTDQDYLLNLHLDQKKPHYQGHSAHNAEYEGPVLEREAERIRTIINKL